jgi:hypothetical protein
MKQFNKASAAALAGTLVTLAAAFWPLESELQGALQTVLVPNAVPAGGRP